MKILIACEFSGIVREAFASAGHEVVSCDLLPTEIPGRHYQGDVFDIIDNGWNMMIAFPPCVYLTTTANKWLKDQPKRKSGVLVGKERRKAQRLASNFFIALANAPIERIAIENPIGVMSTRYRKPDQIISPTMFGHAEEKRTCLWLKGLPILKPTKIIAPEPRLISKSGKRSMPRWYATLKPGIERSKIRSRTFRGIAEAMAEQWG